MAGHYLRKRLRSAVFARRLACFAGILLVVSVVIFRRGAIGFDILETLLLVVAAGLAAALALAVLDLVRIWRKGHEGGGAALAALTIGLFVASPFALALYLALSNAPATSAQTDGMAVAGAEAPQPGGEALISGRAFSARASQIYQAVRLVLGDVGWTVVNVETADPQGADADEAPALPGADEPPPVLSGPIPVPTPRTGPDGEAPGEASAPDPLDRPESGEYRVAAVAQSPILGLPSDVEIRIGEDEEQGYLDLRSTSRFGSRDFGQNRRFIEDFLRRVDAAMIGATTAAPAR